MADVFDGIPLFKHTGQGPMTVAELRQKYGPGLTFTADPAKWRIVRGWERSQVEVITLHFQNEAGAGLAGVTGAYFWPNSPESGVTVVSDANGNIDWAFSAPSFYNADAGEVGPYRFVSPYLEIKGLGSPSKGHAYNHDSMSFDIVVNPRGGLPTVPLSTPTTGTSDAKADLAAALSAISQETLKARDALLRLT